MCVYIYIYTYIYTYYIYIRIISDTGRTPLAQMSWRTRSHIDVHAHLVLYQCSVTNSVTCAFVDYDV